MFSIGKCIRDKALKKPDVVLREHPLAVVAKESAKVTQRILFHPRMFRDQVKRQRCRCKAASNNLMKLCKSCDQWFHYRCVGLTKAEADAAVDWKCGYCVSTPDKDGNCEWFSSKKDETKKSKTAIPVRNVNDTPRNKGIPTDRDDLIWKGPRSWDDIKQMAREGGVKINLAEQRHQAKAQKLVEEGGHHLVDAMTAGGLAARGVDGALTDELYHLNLLGDEEEEEELVEK